MNSRVVTFSLLLLYLAWAGLKTPGVAGTPCPSDCLCKWKGGKQTVECVTKGLRTFPGPMDTGTQVLDVTGNSFETLPPDHFLRLGLTNLQKIFLAKCRLTHLNSRAFRALSNLVELDLSYNLLRDVPSAAFTDCHGLMRLSLSGNPIRIILRHAFSALDTLTTLELSTCGIEVLHKGAFDGLLSLEWLKLDGNKLTEVGAVRSLPLSLKGIWLEDNPWTCDCRLLELRLWLSERNVATSAEPRCAAPNRLVNNTLRELSVDNFACTPELSPTTMYQKIGEGRNVSLLCKVTSVPESTLEWWFNGEPVSNTSLNMQVETSSSWVGGSSSSTAAQSQPLVTNQWIQGAPTERKSELLILNATADENGTFLCVARNPAGVAMANFTLRVLSRQDGDILLDGGIGMPAFVSHYPNLVVIVLSTAAVIALVLLVVLAIVCVCKCCRMCAMKVRRASPESENSGKASRGKRSKGDRVKGGLTGSMTGVSNSSKLERQMSESSSLATTQTKSNGSVFLLSTSSELGDSNPDLIEGVKRVDGDGGADTALEHLRNNGVVFTPATSNMTMTTTSTVDGAPIMDASIFPIEYGLPKCLNVATLVRHSSPTYPLPPTYDLAKYPKEYINPSSPNVMDINYAYLPPLQYPLVPELYPAYLFPHPAYFSTEELGVISTFPGAGCTCTPIMEETEGEKLEEEAPSSSNCPPPPVASVDKCAGTARTMTTAAAVKNKCVGTNPRLPNQRPVCPRVVTNESPDEGYEDEGGEGTEI